MLVRLLQEFIPHLWIGKMLKMAMSGIRKTKKKEILLWISQAVYATVKTL